MIILSHNLKLKSCGVCNEIKMLTDALSFELSLNHQSQDYLDEKLDRLTSALNLLKSYLKKEG